jgi:hypothetical protein
MLVLLLLPLFLCAPRLRQFKGDAIADYSALIAKHGRLVRERWILGREPDDMELLEGQRARPRRRRERALRRRQSHPDRTHHPEYALHDLAAARSAMILLAALQVPKDILSILVKAVL